MNAAGTRAAGRAASGLSAGLVAMMAVAMFINYADRGSLVTGLLLERTGAFSVTFQVASGLWAIGFLIWTFVVPRIEPVAWR